MRIRQKSQNIFEIHSNFEFATGNPKFVQFYSEKHELNVNFHRKHHGEASRITSKLEYQKSLRTLEFLKLFVKTLKSSRIWNTMLKITNENCPFSSWHHGMDTISNLNTLTGLPIIEMKFEFISISLYVFTWSMWIL